jgi:hypothetical protein
MRANALNGLDARVWGHQDRVQFAVGPCRFTATIDEAAVFARQLLDAVDALKATTQPGVTRRSQK